MITYPLVRGMSKEIADRQKSNLAGRAVKFKLNLTNAHSSSVKF